jgi:hypothetical protein
MVVGAVALSIGVGLLMMRALLHHDAPGEPGPPAVAGGRAGPS